MSEQTLLLLIIGLSALVLAEEWLKSWAKRR
jgi:hypothetical protein